MPQDKRQQPTSSRLRKQSWMKRFPSPGSQRNTMSQTRSNAAQESSRSVSSPDEKEGGHGHQWHKQIKRSNNSMETCPHWVNRGRSHSSQLSCSSQESCLSAQDWQRNHWSPVEKIIALCHSSKHLQNVLLSQISEKKVWYFACKDKRSKHSQQCVDSQIIGTWAPFPPP